MIKCVKTWGTSLLDCTTPLVELINKKGNIPLDLVISLSPPVMDYRTSLFKKRIIELLLIEYGKRKVLKPIQ